MSRTERDPELPTAAEVGSTVTDLDAATTTGVSARMSRQRRRDTAPELRLRRELHRRGLRFRVDVAVPGLPRRRADVVFTRARIAVFVDGCFWHSCPDHATRPAHNAAWWSEKLARNVARDRDTDERLMAAGWTVLRFWEHADSLEAADTVEAAWREAAGHRRSGAQDVSADADNLQAGSSR